MNGAYYDGNNNNLRTDGGTQIETKSGIAYGKDISSYNSHNPDPSHIPDGYVFEGWYADKTCTRPFVFTTMPEGGITVYAKWRQIQYRVFLHPNVDAEDISLNWGSDEQAMNFRINYGDKVSTPTGIRADYEFVGWYTDERFMRAFDQNAIVLNETTVRTAYNKTTDYTDPMDKYGNIGDDPYNSDAIGNNGGDRFWITKKYDLYGKWRAILRGAIGINVEYVVGDGNNAPTDTHLYQDHAYAIAGHASSHETKEFSHWVLQHWNGDEYVDTDTRIYPGATFIMLKSDARMDHAVWINPNDSTDIVPERYDPAGLHAPDRTHTVFQATYTIKLRAEYVDVEKPEYTYIKWLWNDGSDTERIDGTSTSSPDLGINVAVNPPVPTRAGYNFKGWYRSNESGATVTDCEPNFLFYNDAFYKESTYTNAVTAVAADKYGSPEYMYAIWEPIVDFTFGDLCPGDQIVLPTKNSANVLISGSWEAITGVVSGATYTASGLNDNLTFTPDPSTCAQETDFDITINTPSVGTSYDYIWKGTSADWNIPTNWYVYNNGYSIATEMPTTDHNIYIGPSQCVKTNWPLQSNEANAKNITIASDATLTVPAGKTLNIAGNLDNIGTLVANGTVVFCGETPSQDQTISNNITLANVRFNNRGGAIVPNGSMTITGTATFTNGNVEGDVTFGENSSVENADDMTFYSFVDGTVTKAGNANGFTFPTGQDDVLGKIKVSSNATNVSVRYFHNSDGFDESEYPRWWNVADNCSDNDPLLDHVSNFEYWKVEGISGDTKLTSPTLKVDATTAGAHF
ncbi:MAG: InlB B-repeat-containing protein, partial [Bacteroidales bacterium]|nr:InlB B-repeat-containing protein [Bacteroidales bacterium]